MKTKLLICGRSGSGKDFLTNYICNELNLKQLLSYATRPKRYDNEDTHVFIEKDVSSYLQATQNILAYTKIGEYEYFSTYEQFMKSDIYIIDYNGIQFFKQKYQDKMLSNDINVVTIYIHTPEKIRLERALKRNGDLEIYEKRCLDENEQFLLMESRVDYDWLVNNTDGDKAKHILKEIVQMYL